MDIGSEKGESSGAVDCPIAPDRRPLDVVTAWDDVSSACRFSRAAWAFVGLGVLLRVIRYLMNYPLWHDEAFVGANFIERGYLDLMRPLDYNQVCPLLFLWVELSAVKLLGFSEWSLRLFPTLCSVAGVVLFRHLAGRVLRGWPMLLAVGIFAVAFFPIRHGGEVKPYASDLLMALTLLVLAVEWWREPVRSRWLWALAGVVPMALGLSYPAAFVAAGIGLVLLAPAWTGGRRTRLALAAYAVAALVSFLIFYILCTGAQSGQVRLRYRQRYWADSFPPLGDPIELLAWLVRMHSGNMLAYPIGGERGASTLTALCVIVAAVVLWRSRRRTLVGLCLAPMGLGLVAAALGRYPYGGEARIMQYLAPASCLLAGLGAAVALAWIVRPRDRLAALRVAAGALALLGVALLTRDLVRPYRTIEDVRTRQFARRFWTEQATDAELACIKTDLRTVFAPRHWDGGLTATYLCNQRIYSPRHRRGSPPDLRSISATRPLRCVLFNEHPVGRPAFAAWMDAMKSRYEVQGCASYTVHTANPSEPWLQERYIVYEFVPKAASRVAGAHRPDPIR